MATMRNFEIIWRIYRSVNLQGLLVKTVHRNATSKYFKQSSIII